MDDAVSPGRISIPPSFDRQGSRPIRAEFLHRSGRVRKEILNARRTATLSRGRTRDSRIYADPNERRRVLGSYRFAIRYAPDAAEAHTPNRSRCDRALATRNDSGLHALPLPRDAAEMNALYLQGL